MEHPVKPIKDAIFDRRFSGGNDPLRIKSLHEKHKDVGMKGMRKVLTAIVFTGLFMGCMGRDFSRYEYLKDPQISRMKGQKMVVVYAEGNPDVVTGKAISYFHILILGNL